MPNMSGKNYTTLSFFHVSKETDMKVDELFKKFIDSDDFSYIDQALDIDKAIRNLNENLFICNTNYMGVPLVTAELFVDIEEFKKDNCEFARNILVDLAKRYKRDDLLLYLLVN